jgi:cell division protein FtsB
VRLLLLLLVALLVALQYKLWFDDGGLQDVWELEGSLAARVAENARLRERNRALEAEVEDLKTGLEAYEERARLEMGMIREGETFFRVVEPEAGREAGKSGSPSGETGE